MSPSIQNLENLLAALPPEDRALFDRIFHLTVAQGHLNCPPTMEKWLKEQFGSVEAVAEQRIIKLTNLVTWEGALFNPLRSQRPVGLKEEIGTEGLVVNGLDEDPFLNPEENTPQDTFGRVKGKHCITASNAAKYDALHALIIFDEPNPLHLSPEQLRDYLETAWKWAELAHSSDPEARHFFFIWNCLWRAGASLVHGHAQVALGRGLPYAKVEALRRAAASYRLQYGSDYFEDLYRVHSALGCGAERGQVRAISYLTPVKDKEVLLFAPDLGPALADALYDVLRGLREKLGVLSFNLALMTPPLGEPEPGWEGFPVLARVVDRGDPASRACDVGAMELYASSVIASDPWAVAAVLKEYLSPEASLG